VTATLDCLISVVVAAAWAPDTLNLGAVGIAAAGVAVGVRRFPLFETFIFSYVIIMGMLAAGFVFTGQLPISLDDGVLIGSMAVLPALVRAASLEPREEGPNDPVVRLVRGILDAVQRLSSSNNASPQEVFQTTAGTLAEYSEATIGGVIVNRADSAVDLFTSLEGHPTVERLNPPSQGDLAARLLALREPVLWTRSDDLNTRGLPDQYPPRLDNLVAAPLPNVSSFGATVFAAHRHRGNFRHEDRIMAVLVAREAGRVTAERDLAIGTSQALGAAAEALLAAAEAKRHGARAQAEESARFSEAISREIGWTDQAIEDVRLAAWLHDIGELAIPDALLDKTEPLTPEEFERIKQHPWVAAKIIDSLNRSELVLGSIYAHHERWDGQGYPSGLAGEDIPQGGRILCLSYATAAMLRGRPYRPPLSPTDTMQEVILGSGTQFDPTIVQAFLSVLQREGHEFLERREPERVAPLAPPSFARYRGLGG
jgi:hypothetical protein